MNAEELAEAFREATTALEDIKTRMHVVADTGALIAYLETKGPSPRVKFQNIALPMADLPMVIEWLCGLAGIAVPAPLPPASAAWTAAPPSEPGWYWYRPYRGDPEEPVPEEEAEMVKARQGDLAIWCQRYESAGSSGTLELMRGLWRGPLTPRSVVVWAEPGPQWTPSPPSEHGYYWICRVGEETPGLYRTAFPGSHLPPDSLFRISDHVQFGFKCQELRDALYWGPVTAPVSPRQSMTGGENDGEETRTETAAGE